MYRFSMLLLVLSMVMLPGIAQAQSTPASASSFIQWVQDAPSLEAARAYKYKVFADDSTDGKLVENVTCTGDTSPYTCQVPFPAFTPGNHKIVMTATNDAGESGKTLTPLDFVFAVTPNPPRDLKITNTPLTGRVKKGGN